jgi:hypothetical protein
MLIKDFQIGSDRVLITFRNSRKREILLDEDSGKAYYRYKLKTLDQIMHTGIYVGADERGGRYYIHNHTEQGYASIVTEKEFSQEQEIFEHDKESQFPPMEVLTRALEKAMEGEPYKLLTNNCQTFTNHSRTDRRHSEDVIKWSLISGGIITAIAGSITYLLTRSGKK